MRLKIAYSPCPNDTFAFHALANGLIDLEGIEPEIILADVEHLNRAACRESYDVCKLSYHAFFMLSQKYSMLTCGSALGRGNGPLFVTNRRELSNIDTQFAKKELKERGVLIPGQMTTVALLLKIAYPWIDLVEEMLFSDIERELLEDRVGYGVLIHEGRFTYQDRGLLLISDLGELWQKMSGLPVPLGGIAVSNKLDINTAEKVGRVLKRSIEFAFKNPRLSQEYVKINAQEIDLDVIKKHIELFVNEETLEISNEGRRAVYTLYKRASEINPQIRYRENIFIL